MSIYDDIKQAITDGLAQGFASLQQTAGPAARNALGGLNQVFNTTGVTGPDFLRGTLDAVVDTGKLTAAYKALTLESGLLKEGLDGVGGALFNVGLEARQAAISFNSTTGFAGEFDDAIINIRENLKAFPVDAKDVSDAALKLSQGFSDFTLGGIEPTEQRLASTITILGKLGASVDNQVKIIQGLRKGFSQSDQQIDISLRQFEALADTLNVDLGTVMSNFAAQIPLFGAFGDNAVSTFKKLQMQSKGTGLELNKLVEISEKFTTFEGAASTIGQLNQILGDTGILPTDLVQAALEDPAKAIELLQDALGGFDVENLSGGMKRVLSDILGFGSDITGFISFARGGTQALESLGEQAIKTDMQLLEGVRKGTDPAAMAKAMANLGLSIDGTADRLVQFENFTFTNMIDSAIELRETMDSLQGRFDLDKLLGGLTGAAGQFQIIQFFKTLFEPLSGGVENSDAFKNRVKEEREMLRTTLAESVSNIQVHVYLDKSQLAKQLGDEILSAGAR